MVPLLFRESADGVRERQRLREVVEREYPPQALDAVDLDELPVGDLRHELGDLGIGHGRRVAAARDALHLREGFRHRSY